MDHSVRANVNRESFRLDGEIKVAPLEWARRVPVVSADRVSVEGEEISATSVYGGI